MEPAALEKFRAGLKGQLIVAGDPGYDRARAVASFNPTTDKHPQLIVRCANREDVARAVSFAREQSIEVAVRGGGHDVLGASVCEGGMVIDLSPMKDIHIDPTNRTAQVQAGVRSGELNGATQQHGLAAALGCHQGVGVAGLTLGGGLGWFLGKFGAACDHLLGADVVTADGKILRASANETPDLFWAIRGGGGNFGIVTSLDYQLHPVDTVFGGIIAFRGDIAKFLQFYRDFMKSAPGELAAELSMFVQEQPTIFARVCWSGSIADGERVLRPLRSFGPPVAEAIEVVPYAHLTDPPKLRLGSAPPASAETGPICDYWRGGSIRELNDAAANQIAAAAQSAPAGWTIGLGHYTHGQICRVPPEATPLVRTEGQFTCFFDAHWRDPHRADAAMEWVNNSLAAMRPFSSEGTYINYLSSESEAAVRASYGQSYQKLAAIKRKYDPGNFFHLNRNIRPAHA